MCRAQLTGKEGELLLKGHNEEPQNMKVEHTPRGPKLEARNVGIVFLTTAQNTGDKTLGLYKVGNYNQARTTKGLYLL